MQIRAKNSKSMSMTSSAIVVEGMWDVIESEGTGAGGGKVPLEE